MCLRNRSAGDLTLGDVAVDRAQALMVLPSHVDGSWCVEHSPPGLNSLPCARSRFRYTFLEYASPGHALDAVKNADGYKLDKQHTFRVNLFTDFDKYVPAG